ncbi:MAG: CvpA family protein, partial [Planctomycetota bacterium]|jgi:hypothetical protein
MAVLTVLSAAIAFNYYEPLAVSLYDTQPAYAQAISLIAIFVLVLLFLRAVADWAVRGNVVLGSDVASVWIERVVAGALGLVTGMMLVGMLTIALQMLPFGRGVMGYESFDASLKGKHSLAPFYADEVALGVVEMLSSGSLSGERKYSDEHDDLRLETFCSRNTAGWHGRVDAPLGSIKVTAVEDFDIRKFRPPVRKPSWNMKDHHPIVAEAARTGGNLIRVTLLVNVSARDEDGAWRLPGTHFRLVSKKAKSYYPLAGAVADILDKRGKPLQTVFVAVADKDGEVIYGDVLSRYVLPANRMGAGHGGRWDVCRLALFAAVPSPGDLAKAAGAREEIKARPENLVVEWIYRLDPGDSPDYLVFRRIARAEIP